MPRRRKVGGAELLKYKSARGEGLVIQPLMAVLSYECGRPLASTCTALTLVGDNAASTSKAVTNFVLLRARLRLRPHAETRKNCMFLRRTNMYLEMKNGTIHYLPSK